MTGHLDIGYNRQRNRETTDNWTYRTGLGRPITEREILINGEWHVEQFEEEVNSSYFSDDEFDDESDKSKKFFHAKCV